MTSAVRDVFLRDGRPPETAHPAEAGKGAEDYPSSRISGMGAAAAAASPE